MNNLKNCMDCVRRCEQSYCPRRMIKMHGPAYAQWCPWFRTAENAKNGFVTLGEVLLASMDVEFEKGGAK